MLEPYNFFLCSISITSIVILRIAYKFVLMTKKLSWNQELSKKEKFCMKLHTSQMQKVNLVEFN